MVVMSLGLKNAVKQLCGHLRAESSIAVLVFDKEKKGKQYAYTFKAHEVRVTFK